MWSRAVISALSDRTRTIPGPSPQPARKTVNQRRTVRVDDEVYAAIRDRSESMTDTPNRVLRRQLGLPDAPPTPRPGTTAIQAALRAHPGATAAELAHAADRAYSTTTNVLTALRNDGLAIRRGGGPQPGHRGRASYTWWPAEPTPNDGSRPPQRSTGPDLTRAS